MPTQMVDVDVENKAFNLPAEFAKSLKALKTYAAAETIFTNWLKPFSGGLAEVSQPDKMGTVRARIYEEAEGGSYLLELLGAALIEVKGNRGLQELAERIPLRAQAPVGDEEKYRLRLHILDEAHKRNQVAGTQRLLSAVLGNEDARQGAADGFERLFPDNPYQNPSDWERRKREIEGRVCRIVRADTGDAVEPIGTGFLVGPDLVLTNFHVIADPATGISYADFPTGYRCQFDYLQAGDSGTLLELAANPLVDKSSAKAPPQADGLDFALLRIAAALGNENTTSGEKRGYERLNNLAQPGSNSVVVVFQHPGEQALRFSAGPLTAPITNNYVKHRASTEPGSSGAPCFDFSLRLLALHHRGPDSDDNYAVRLSAIAAQIQPYLPD